MNDADLNPEQLAAVESLVRHVGWGVLLERWATAREGTVANVMKPSTDPQVREHLIERQFGRDEVLSWPEMTLSEARRVRAERSASDG